MSEPLYDEDEVVSVTFLARVSRMQVAVPAKHIGAEHFIISENNKSSDEEYWSIPTSLPTAISIVMLSEGFENGWIVSDENERRYSVVKREGEQPFFRDCEHGTILQWKELERPLKVLLW